MILTVSRYVYWWHFVVCWLKYMIKITLHVTVDSWPGQACSCMQHFCRMTADPGLWGVITRKYNNLILISNIHSYSAAMNQSIRLSAKYKLDLTFFSRMILFIKEWRLKVIWLPCSILIQTDWCLKQNDTFLFYCHTCCYVTIEEDIFILHYCINGKCQHFSCWQNGSNTLCTCGYLFWNR